MAASSLKRFAKQSAIRVGLEGVALTRAGSFWPGAGGRGVIFTLHHVRPGEPDANDPNAHLSVTPEFLDEAIVAAKEAGLTPVALEALPHLLADQNDNRRFVAFTLDDGYRNNAEHAAPAFRRHGVPYTIFITRGFVERTHSLWWETAQRLVARESAIELDFGSGIEAVACASPDQKLAAFERIAQMVAAIDEDEAVARLDRLAKSRGIDPLALTATLTMNAGELAALAADPLCTFGAHTLTHINMRRVSDKRLREEIALSATAVETYAGRAPKAFAYPYGFAAAVGEREIRTVADAGFTIAVTTQPGVLGPHNLKAPTAFPRVSLNGLYQKKRYVTALLSGIPFKLTG